MNKLSYKKWEEWYIKNNCTVTEEQIEVGCFVEKTGSKYYTECLSKLRELYDITTC